MAGYCTEHQQPEPCQVCGIDVQIVMRAERTRLPRRAPIAEREMWVIILAGIQGLVRAIDAHGDGKPMLVAMRGALQAISMAIELRWGFRRQLSTRVDIQKDN